MSNKLEVGMNVWVVGGIREKPHFETITKVSRKYFYTANLELESWHRFETKFCIDTLDEFIPKNGYSNYLKHAYLNQSEHLDEVEYTTLKQVIGKYFNSYGKLPISLEDLRTIKALIDKEK